MISRKQERAAYGARLMLGAMTLLLAAISRTVPAADAPAPVNKPARESFEKYQVLVTNNIFVRDRVRYSPRESAPGPVAPALGPEEATVLRGVVRQLESPGAPYFAYLEDVRTGATMKVRIGDPVCQGKLINPTLDHVDYVKNGVTTRVEIGKNLTGANAAPASPPPSVNSRGGLPSEADSAANSPTLQPIRRGSGASVAPGSTTPPASPDSIAEQMRQKRLKELGK